jgi:integrase/recombinase XerD
VIDGLSRGRRVRKLQHEAPLLAERVSYLSHLLREGISKWYARSTACMLLHVIRLLGLQSLRPVQMAEVVEASERWMTNAASHTTRRAGRTSRGSFTNAAAKWLQFHQSLILPLGLDGPLGPQISEFIGFLREYRKLSPSHVHRNMGALVALSKWANEHGIELSAMSVLQIDQYLREKRCSLVPRGPSWKDVQRLFDANSGSSPRQLRTKAILLLYGIYALRSAEVLRLTLEDLDWRNETLTVRRAKTGRIQQFPLQFDVGNAIIKYLYVRPRCSCRNLFVTVRTPHRPISNQLLRNLIAEQMDSAGVTSNNRGPHALRHACATELLRKGTGLRDIADFLGHRDCRSVGIYAKHDLRSLRKVAAFSLRGIL